MKKPTSAAGYDAGLAVEARRVCLYLATILGDLAEDIVVVGGLVPYLIVDQETAAEPHVGTRDLDLGLSLALLDRERYREISARLRDRGFRPAAKPRSGDHEVSPIIRQTWELPGTPVTVDFLIPEGVGGPPPGRLRGLESDFAAIVTPALAVAFLDRVSTTLDAHTAAEERARRDVWVCGPAALVVMKAHAFRLRGENKDAYDLVYVLKNYAEGNVAGVAQRYALIAQESVSVDALSFLEDDFASPEHVGPRRAAEFRTGRNDPALQAEAYGYVQELLSRVKRG